MTLNTEKLKFDKYEITIDAEKLRFDEQNLSNYIQTEGGHYDNIGAYLSLAEKNLQNKEVLYEKIYCERFEEAKEEGSSDKLAEAKSKKDNDVVDSKIAVIEARYAVNRLKNHLKAWDKNHDNAQSLGHMLRKQMDKLQGDIFGSVFKGSGVDEEVKDTVKSFPNKDDSFETNLSIENLF